MNPELLSTESEQLTSRERMREFISTISHELRTPLTSIRGALGLLESKVIDPGSEEGAKLIRTARISSDLLVRLINNILDLKSLQSGQFQLFLEQVAPYDLIERTLEPLQAMAEEKGILLVHETNQTPYILADKERTTQVLTNLISNAIKFAPTGSRVSVKAVPCKLNKARLYVCDDGPGIPADQVHKIFGKFQQLDSSDTREHGGSGLGLALCKGIIEEQGGEIGVRNNPGAGSTFWFELPLWEEQHTDFEMYA